MALMHRYQQAVDELLAKVRDTQTDAIIKAGEIIANSVATGGKIYLDNICHSIEMDSICRGGGPIIYRKFKKEEDMDKLKANDVMKRRSKHYGGNGYQQNNKHVDNLVLPFVLLESGENTEAETYRNAEKS